jgi:hypothetical protein
MKLLKTKGRICNVPAFFIKLPENPRLSSLGMNGARSEAR